MGNHAVFDVEIFKALKFVFTLSEFKCLNLLMLHNCHTFAIPYLVEKNPRTGNLGSLIKVFLSRTKELKISAECQK